MIKVLISVFKPSGKWNYDTYLHVPEEVTTYKLLDFMESKIKSTGIIVIHTDCQPSDLAKDLVGFPRMILPKEEE